MAHANIQNTKNTIKPVVNEDKIFDTSPSINTYNALIKAPHMITSMGYLLIITAKQDFSLPEKSDNAKFKYIKHPDSFNACAVQVSHAIKHAFNTAHRNMNCIRMKSKNIVENVGKAIRVMNERKKNEWTIVERYLRDTGKECAECIETAASITKEFMEVDKTMEELLEALATSMIKHKNEEGTTSLEMQTTREKQEIEKQRKNEQETTCLETLIEIEDAKNKYEETKKNYEEEDISASWKTKLRRSVDLAVNYFFKLKASVPTNETVEPSTIPEISNEEANAYLVANDIFNHAKMLMPTSCDKNDIAKVKISLEEKCSNPNLDVPESVVSVVKKLCKDGIEICNEICKEIDQAKNRSAATDAQVEKFFERAKDFYYKHKAKYILKNVERPESTDENRSGQKPEGRLTKAALETSKGNEREAREKLVERYESYEKKYNEMAQTTEKIEKILDEIEKFDHQILDLEKIQDAVANSKKELGIVIEHWGKFKMMFEELQDFIKIRQEKKIELVKDTFSNNQASKSKNYQMVLEDSEKALQNAHVVEETSSLYCCISEKYLLDGVARLQRIMSLDPIKDRDKMEEIKQELQNGRKRAKNEIFAIAQKQREDFKKKLKSH